MDELVCLGIGALFVFLVEYAIRVSNAAFCGGEEELRPGLVLPPKEQLRRSVQWAPGDNGLDGLDQLTLDHTPGASLTLRGWRIGAEAFAATAQDDSYHMAMVAMATVSMWVSGKRPGVVDYDVVGRQTYIDLGRMLTEEPEFEEELTRFMIAFGATIDEKGDYQFKRFLGDYDPYGFTVQVSKELALAMCARKFAPLAGKVREVEEMLWPV